MFSALAAQSDRIFAIMRILVGINLTTHGTQKLLGALTDDPGLATHQLVQPGQPAPPRSVPDEARLSAGSSACATCPQVRLGWWAVPEDLTTYTRQKSLFDEEEPEPSCFYD